MANLAAADITVTILNKRKSEDGKNRNNVSLAFGDASKTYGAGGVPITIGSLGCPNAIESLTVYDNGISAYSWSYDRTNKKLTATSAGSEISTTAIAAQVIKAEVIGW